MGDICKICKKKWPTLVNSFFSDSSLEEKRVLVKDKYYIHFKPVLYVLNKVEAITKTPTSPMEIWFHGKYGKFIQDMMVKIFFIILK
jgi:hypothetical protein